MASNTNTLAIFDFDGTLTSGHLWLGIAKYHRRHKVGRLSLYFYLIFHLPLWLAAKAKLYSEEKNRAKWGEDLPVLLKGFSREESRKIFLWVMDNYFMPLMHTKMLEQIDEDKKQGHKTVLLSGMFTDFLEVVASKLGIDYVVGTRLELLNGKYTGHIIQPLCFGENKAKLLRDFIQQKKLNVNFEHSVAYADSIYDMPVFKLVGHPVATYPDKKLYNWALENKWKII